MDSIRTGNVVMCILASSVAGFPATNVNGDVTAVRPGFILKCFDS